MTKDKVKKIIFPIVSIVIIFAIILCCFIFLKPKKESYAFLSIDKIEMPTLNIKGDLSKATVEKNEITVGFEYSDENQTFDGFAELKVQGASSTQYPKKNYNIKLFKDENLTNKNKVTLVDSWGKQNKYCLKANYIDFSQARNVVSAGIYGQIVRSRGNVDELYSLPNGGAIDGYPVAVYNNDNFHGIYTLNIPKDEWMFGMDDESIEQAMVMCDDWVNFSDGISESWKGYELEYCSTEETTGTDWVRTSFNNMIDFVVNNQGNDFKNGIANYVNVDRAIDSMIYTMLIGGLDNTLKNILWVTFDGDVWIPSMYDMDSTWGLFWQGTSFFEADKVLMPDYMLNGSNTLWLRLLESYKQEVIDRYFELRKSALSIENIATQFKNFKNKIPNIALEMEKNKWTEVTLNQKNHYEQIVTFAVDRALIFDNWFNNLKTA